MRATRGRWGVDAKVQVQKISPKPGDVVILRYKNLPRAGQMQADRDAVQRVLPAGCEILLIVGELEVQAFDEQQLREVGLTRLRD